MPSSHLILCRPLLLLPPIPPSIRVFANESTLCIRWPKYWSYPTYTDRMRFTFLFYFSRRKREGWIYKRQHQKDAFVFWVFDLYPFFSGYLKLFIHKTIYLLLSIEDTQGQGRQPRGATHVQGAVAVWAQEAWEELLHVPGQERRPRPR